MRFILVCSLGIAMGVSACVFDFEGGANTHQQTAGNESGGVRVDDGNIAVSPHGDYLVAGTAGGLKILRPGLALDPTGLTVSRLSSTRSVPVKSATRIAF